MYFVNRKQMTETLAYMTDILQIVKQQSQWNTPLEKLALERSTHVIIEALIDVGNRLIDGFIMRDPGSYDDIFNILTDENVIEEDEAKTIKNIVAARKELIRHYEKVDHQMLLSRLKNAMPVLEKFPRQVKAYLDEEMGPVSAFSPLEDGTD